MRNACTGSADDMHRWGIGFFLVGYVECDANACDDMVPHSLSPQTMRATLMVGASRRNVKSGLSIPYGWEAQGQGEKVSAPII